MGERAQAGLKVDTIEPLRAVALDARAKPTVEMNGSLRERREGRLRGLRALRAPWSKRLHGPHTLQMLDLVWV
jgi:hypothetical protein